jgi:Na+-translocating ferredoxin:NAD+ oxidoreductase RnfE subunit
MPITGRLVERREPARVLVVDEGLRALYRQQRADLRCVTITRGFPKLLTCHHNFCFFFLFFPPGYSIYIGFILAFVSSIHNKQLDEST